MKELALVNIGSLVTCKGSFPKRGKEMGELGIITNAAVVTQDDKIVFAGTMAEFEKNFSGKEPEILDCKGKAVLPGFVDSHTHLVFGGYRADEFNWRQNGVSYMEIMNRGGGIASSTQATREASEEELLAVALKRLESMMSYGVTTVEAKSGYGMDKGTELKQLRVVKKLQALSPMTVVPTYMGAHSVPKEFKEEPDRYIDFIINEVLPVVAKEKLAEFCDVFCEKNVFSISQSKWLLLEAQRLGLGAKIHADEIVCLGGAELAAEIGCQSADHLLKASDEGIRKLANSNTVATLLPATAFCLKEPYANGRKMIDSGCAVAIASDFNPGSCFTESIPLLIALSVINMGFSIEETITALTINGAAAVGKADKVGSIEVNKQADLLVLQWPDIGFLSYHTACNGIEAVIKNGVKVL